jgi:hypothetical protein
MQQHVATLPQQELQQQPQQQPTVKVVPDLQGVNATVLEVRGCDAS